MTRSTQVMIVEDNRQLAESIQIFFVVKNVIKITGIASNSLEAIKLMERSEPDVIILDLVMPRSDGFVLLEYLNRAGCENRPEVIILSSLSNDKIIKRASDLGATYYMVKPFSVEDLHERVIDISEFREKPMAQPVNAFTDADSIDKCIYNLLLDLGISAGKKGYRYVCESVKLVVAQPKLINSITKDIYPKVAQMHHTQPTSVERAIRYAIRDGWDRMQCVDRAVGDFVDMRNVPSNGKLISLISRSVIKSISSKVNDFEKGVVWE